MAAHQAPCPWDSPGKNTGVGCHFLLQCMKVKSESEVAQSCPTPSDPHGLQPTRPLRPWDFPSKSTGVGCHCLLRFNDLAKVIMDRHGRLDILRERDGAKIKRIWVQWIGL